MVWKCCVWTCKSTVKSPGIKLFRFPTVGKCLQQLASERIKEWKSVLGYGNNFTPFNKRVCSVHFRSGKPAKLTDTQDPDWVPSLRLSKPRSKPSSSLKQRSTGANPKQTDARVSSSFSSGRSSVTSVRRDSRENSEKSVLGKSLDPLFPKSPSCDSSKLFSRRKSRTAATTPGVSQKSMNSNPTPAAGSSASDSHGLNSCARERSDSELSVGRSDTREKSEDSASGRSWTSISPKSQRCDSSKLSPRQISDSPLRSTDSNFKPEACSFDSTDSTDRSDSELSSIQRDSRDSSRKTVSEQSWNSFSPKSQSCDSSKSSRQQSSTTSTASIASGESSCVTQRNVDLYSRSPGSNSFSRPNVTPLLTYDYKDDKPKMKNASTMTDACSDPYKMIEYYQRELQRLQGKINSIQNQADFFERGFEFISVSDEKCLYYTGITSFSTVKKIYEYLKPNLSEPYCDFSTEQMFVMTLTKLRLNPQFQTLAYDYNVCCNTISKYFHRTLQVMDTCLGYALKHAI